MNKTICVALACIALSGCASVAPYTYQEHCALQGMRLHGVTDSQSSAVAFGYRGAPIVAGGSGTAVSCVVPETPKDKCEVERYQQIAEPKVEYNNGVGTKRVINGFADVLIVPGIVAAVIYSNQKSDAIEQSQKLSQTLGKCQDDGRMPGSISVSSQ